MWGKWKQGVCGDLYTACNLPSLLLNDTKAGAGWLSCTRMMLTIQQGPNGTNDFHWIGYACLRLGKWRARKCDTKSSRGRTGLSQTTQVHHESLVCCMPNLKGWGHEAGKDSQSECTSRMFATTPLLLSLCPPVWVTVNHIHSSKAPKMSKKNRKATVKPSEESTVGRLHVVWQC